MVSYYTFSQEYQHITLPVGVTWIHQHMSFLLQLQQAAVAADHLRGIRAELSGRDPDAEADPRGGAFTHDRPDGTACRRTDRLSGGEQFPKAVFPPVSAYPGSLPGKAPGRRRQLPGNTSLGSSLRL